MQLRAGRLLDFDIRWICCLRDGRWCARQHDTRTYEQGNLAADTFQKVTVVL